MKVNKLKRDLKVMLKGRIKVVCSQEINTKTTRDMIMKEVISNLEDLAS